MDPLPVLVTRLLHGRLIMACKLRQEVFLSGHHRVRTLFHAQTSLFLTSELAILSGLSAVHRGGLGGGFARVSRKVSLPESGADLLHLDLLLDLLHDFHCLLDVLLDFLLLRGVLLFNQG